MLARTHLDHYGFEVCEWLCKYVSGRHVSHMLLMGECGLSETLKENYLSMLVSYTFRYVIIILNQSSFDVIFGLPTG